MKFLLLVVISLSQLTQAFDSKGSVLQKIYQEHIQKQFSTRSIMAPFYDAEHSYSLDGTINDGIIYSSQEYWTGVKEEILSQLFFTLGQLNHYGAVAKLTNIKLQYLSRERLANSYRYHYKAELEVIWPRANTYPSYFNLILPERGNSSFLQGPWFSTYANQDNINTTDLACFEGGDYTMTIYNHWYHYRPHNLNCLLRTRQPGESDLAVNFPMSFRYSERNTSNKYPEYGEIWKDNKLSVFVINGQAYKKKDDNDPGVIQYRSLYNRLISRYGTPISSNIPYGSYVGTDTPDINLVFDLGNGKTLEVNMLLTKEIRTETWSFQQKYNQYLQDADFFFYGGHAGLGAGYCFT